MRATLRWLLGVLCVLIVGMAVGACRPREPRIVEVPTLAVLPSASFTFTPSRTPYPTWTNTFTPTPSVTPTSTVTPLPSSTPTLTDTPSITPSVTPTWTGTITQTPSLTLTITPTSTPTPAPTLTSTPAPTSTPSRTLVPLTGTPIGGYSPTPPGPTIFSFTANAASVLSGTPIMLTWAADADLTQIEQIDSSATRIFQTISVPASGQYSIVAQPGSGRQAIFRLVATRNGVVRTSTPVTVVFTCAASWFFGDQYAPAGSGCAAAAGAVGGGAFQRFDNGFMIYLNANGLNRICIGQTLTQQYVCVANGWNGSSINTTPAPSGRFIPGQMLNWAYYNTLGFGGTWNALLGWGTMDIAVGDRTVQWENSVGGTNAFYVDTADGTIIRFSGGDTGTWARIR